MRERVARRRELREEAPGDGDVEPPQVGGERLGLVGLTAGMGGEGGGDGGRVGSRGGSSG